MMELPMSSDFNFSASPNSTLDLHEQVEKWRRKAEPLSEIQEIALWMASKIARETELFHHEVVSYISKTYGPKSKYLSTSRGQSSIDDDLIALFKEPFNHPPKWRGAVPYPERKWSF